MRTLPFFACLAFATALHAQSEPPSLREKIEELKSVNRSRATPEKLAAYDEGIKAVVTAKVVESAKKVGDVAPDFTLRDAKGNEVTLSDELKKGPVVLTWYRGGWCPYCNVQLAAYQQILPQIEELGARLIAVSPELPDKALATAQKGQLKFTVISDLNLKVAAEYGLVFELTPEVTELYAAFFSMKDYNGAEASTNELPLAATYVIAPDGKIVYSFLHADYTKRAEPREILAALDAIE
jgi:peroxiredoxin